MTKKQGKKNQYFYHPLQSKQYPEANLLMQAISHLLSNFTILTVDQSQ
uniref:Uncharacterized protein n=1 Tax=Setaria italica TaxID=4555 RepID=K4A4L6_SETIT